MLGIAASLRVKLWWGHRPSSVSIGECLLFAWVPAVALNDGWSWGVGDEKMEETLPKSRMDGGSESWEMRVIDREKMQEREIDT